MSRHGLKLIAYDLLCLVAMSLLVLWFYPSPGGRILGKVAVAEQFLIAAFCVIGCRVASGIYGFVWRYGSNALNIRLMLTDVAAGALYYALQMLLPVQNVEFLRAVSLIALNLLGSMAMRQVYQYMYEKSETDARMGKAMKLISGVDNSARENQGRRIKVAIVGAGQTGVSLAMDLKNNPRAAYTPVLFIDVDREKIGRSINGVPVVSEDEEGVFEKYGIQEVVFAVSSASPERKKELYERYKGTGCKLKTYDYPTADSLENGKRSLREFDVEELLFRAQADFLSQDTMACYTGKSILITGGGGSIGSELARQLARTHPARLVLLDIYENCVYDIQQELRIKYGNDIHLAAEIVSITDRGELEKVFTRHRPQIVVHAAAHKHVPLMETNCSEAIKNNVFGTKTLLETAERFGVERFIMLSTDKAVNPTNVMGATKRMCELMVLGHRGRMICTATRFGNVLGSNGSVIPLFKRQVQAGGPVTVTDKRIIRYFMTIPEAAQLVLTSGVMAANRELFVLDMGKPVKILDLAENLIRLSGYEPYRDIDIVETGLRPGEKLYEELLVQTDNLDKTANSKIFVEREQPISDEALEKKLELLSRAAATSDDDLCRQALHEAVETYRNPDEVNRKAEKAEEMRRASLAD